MLIRNISCTCLFSKVLEFFVLKRLREEVAPRINQFGGLPGSGINHYLTSAWNNVLEAMEHDENSAVNMISVDFAKAFNTMGHKSCITAFESKGATEHSVAMVAAFLRGRRMRFKAGKEMSSERLVKGGSPQGTLLGNLLFVIATDNLEYGDRLDTSAQANERWGSETDTWNNEHQTWSYSDSMTDQNSFTYMGDVDRAVNMTGAVSGSEGEGDGGESLNERQITFAETGSPPTNWTEQPITVYKYVDDFLGVEKICTNSGQMHLSQNKTQITVRANKSEEFYNTVVRNSAQVGMSVNERKTQMLCVSPALHSDVKTVIRAGNTIIDSQKTLKILGFIFGSSPDISEQIDSIVTKFRRRVWVLRHLRKANIPHADLVKLYSSLVLPVLDFTCVIYHSMLTKTQAQKLESLQKLALKIIYGVTGVPYTELLERSGLQTLHTRRLKMVDKFITKASKHPTYSAWFPIRHMTGYDLRVERIYHEKRARTQRLYNSPLYFFRRRLNCI